MNRRDFASTLALAASGHALCFRTTWAQAAPGPQGNATLSLAPGSIGVQAGQSEAIALAYRHGFGSVEPFPAALAELTSDQNQELLGTLKSNGLVWGAAGLPVEFRQDDARFESGLRGLPAAAEALRRAGVGRVGTWISPGHSRLTYLENFKRHAARLREVARILKDHGQRLGLEYVGTKTSRDRSRFPFIHTLIEVRELITEIGTGNVGVVLDSWHWWQAEDTPADLDALRNEEVVSVDLNDAPKGLAKEQQLDNQRELPAATGVIPIAPFVAALRRIQYDGPIRAEPFNRALNDLDNDAACAAAIAALKRAWDPPTGSEPAPRN